MNLEDLRAIIDDERRSDGPQQLPDDFYAEVGAYLQELKAERATAARDADDPFGSDAVNRLTHEIETAESTVESLWDRRVGKILRHASLAAGEDEGPPTALTNEERAFFEHVVSAIERHREQALGPLHRDPDGAAAFGADAERPAAASTADATGESHPDSVADPDTGPKPSSATDGTDTSSGRGTSSEGANDGAAADGEPDEDTADAGSVDRMTVRITQDVGSILGVDQTEYYLETDDVATLPVANAEPLVERDAAEPVD